MRIVSKMQNNTFGDYPIKIYSTTILETGGKISIVFVNTGEDKTEGVTEGAVVNLPFDVARAISKGIECVLDTKIGVSFNVSEDVPEKAE